MGRISGILAAFAICVAVCALSCRETGGGDGDAWTGDGDLDCAGDPCCGVDCGGRGYCDLTMEMDPYCACWPGYWDFNLTCVENCTEGDPCCDVDCGEDARCYVSFHEPHCACPEGTVDVDLECI